MPRTYADYQAELRTAAASRKDTRRDQIQRLKATFANGHYTEDPEQIAMRLVDHGHKLAALVTHTPREVSDDR